MTTAWLDVETEKGMKKIMSVDMGTSDAPTIRIGRDRYRICEMDFPDNQQDMKTPFVDAMARAIAVLLIHGIYPTQFDAVRVSGDRVHLGADVVIAEAFAAIALHGVTTEQNEILSGFVPQLRIRIH